MNPPSDPLVYGKMSTFGGPDDKDMSEDTGLAFYEPHEADARPDLFNPGPANVPTWKRLKTDASYIALNLPTNISRKVLQKMQFLVTNPKTGKSEVAHVVDRGPGAADRVADLSPGLAGRLGLNTNDVVQVTIHNPEYSGANASSMNADEALAQYMAATQGKLKSSSRPASIAAIPLTDEEQQGLLAGGPIPLKGRLPI